MIQTRIIIILVHMYPHICQLIPTTLAEIVCGATVVTFITSPTHLSPVSQIPYLSGAPLLTYLLCIREFFFRGRDMLRF